MRIDLDKKVDGYRVFKGRVDGEFDGHLLANIQTKHHRGPGDSPDEQVGTSRGGSVIYDGLPRPHWRIHFTNSEMKLDDVVAVVAALPSEA
jgi:hypothetical protein